MKITNLLKKIISSNMLMIVLIFVLCICISKILLNNETYNIYERIVKSIKTINPTMCFPTFYLFFALNLF